MTTLQLMVTLPDELATMAQLKRLLSHDRLSLLLRRALEREEALDRLSDAADALSALEPPLMPEEIDVEVKEESYARARQRHLRLLEEGLNLGTHGQIHTTRDQLHERR